MLSVRVTDNDTDAVEQDVEEGISSEENIATSPRYAPNVREMRKSTFKTINECPLQQTVASSRIEERSCATESSTASTSTLTRTISAKNAANEQDEQATAEVATRISHFLDSNTPLYVDTDSRTTRLKALFGLHCDAIQLIAFTLASLLSFFFLFSDLEEFLWLNLSARFAWLPLLCMIASLSVYRQCSHQLCVSTMLFCVATLQCACLCLKTATHLAEACFDISLPSLSSIVGTFQVVHQELDDATRNDASLNGNISTRASSDQHESVQCPLDRGTYILVCVLLSLVCLLCLYGTVYSSLAWHESIKLNRLRVRSTLKASRSRELSADILEHWQEKQI